MDTEIRPIGYMQSVFRYKNGTPRQSLLCKHAKGVLRIEKSVFNNPEHSLEGLENFSHVWIIFVFHKNGGCATKAKVRPPRLNGQRVGIFSTRSPHRPNPIGLTLAKLDGVRGDKIFVSGIDVIDGTPILDVKPYIQEYDAPVVDVGMCGKHQNTDSKLQNPDSKMQDIETKLQNPDIKQEDISSKHQDNDSKLLDSDSKEQDIVTKQEDIDTKQHDYDSKLSDYDSKEQDIVTMQKNIDTKQQDIDTKQQDIDAKEQDIDSKLQDIDSKLQDIDSKQQDIHFKLQYPNNIQKVPSNAQQDPQHTRQDSSLLDHTEHWQNIYSETPTQHEQCSGDTASADIETNKNCHQFVENIAKPEALLYCKTRSGGSKSEHFSKDGEDSETATSSEGSSFVKLSCNSINRKDTCRAEGLNTKINSDVLEIETDMTVQTSAAGSWIGAHGVSSSWIPDVDARLSVLFTERAERQLCRFSKCPVDQYYKLSLLQNGKEVRESIISILVEDPRSVYRRHKCKDSLYYFVVDRIHVTCWFDNNLAEVVRIQPVEHACEFLKK